MQYCTGTSILLLILVLIKTVQPYPVLNFNKGCKFKNLQFAALNPIKDAFGCWMWSSIYRCSGPPWCHCDSSTTVLWHEASKYRLCKLGCKLKPVQKITIIANCRPLISDIWHLTLEIFCDYPALIFHLFLHIDNDAEVNRNCLNQDCIMVTQLGCQTLKICMRVF
jgi:hypothetical protein